MTSAAIGLFIGAVVVALTMGGAALIAARSAAHWKSECLRARYGERKAREMSERLAKAVDSTSTVMYMRDPEGRYLLVNRQYEHLFNVTRDGIVGLTDYDLFPKEMADAFRANDLKALAEGAPIQIEEIAPHPDGPHNYVTVKYPINDAEGHPYAVCGVSTDITELKRAEEQIRRLNDELEQRVLERTAELEAATGELDAFTYSVSHDLRAPLRTLTELSGILHENYSARLDEKGRGHLQKVRFAAERIGRLIDGMLEMSNVAKAQVNRAPIDLSELARKVVAELDATEQARHVAADIEENIVVAADPQLLELVLRNLLSNAWRLTAATPEPHVEIGVTHRDKARVFFVRDNGAGFVMDDGAGLSVPLERLTTIDDPRGIGVRLAIVARVVSRHGGQAWAESEPRKGSTFYFTLGPAKIRTPSHQA